MRKTLIILLFLILPVFAVNAQYKDTYHDRDTVSLAFIGDVMTHQRQIDFALQAGDGVYYNYDSYFEHTGNYLKNADLAVANMEFPCGVKPYSGYPCFSAPPELPEHVAKCGVDVFLTANNHICDKGRDGLDSTYAIYNRMGIAYTGFYANPEEEEANNPLIMDVRGIKIAFVNFTYDLNGFTPAEPYVVNQMDSVEVKNAISRAGERGADFIIVCPHWGVEYSLDYSAEQTKWTEMLYRAGADMIIGTHPHVVQAVEYDGKRLTAYSLGNYISNMSIENGQIGILANIKLAVNNDGSIEILPPETVYMWCGKGGLLESNYTVVPIEEYLNKKESFASVSQYHKMKREWNKIKKKFSIE